MGLSVQRYWFEVRINIFIFYLLFLVILIHNFRARFFRNQSLFRKKDYSEFSGHFYRGINFIRSCSTLTDKFCRFFIDLRVPGEFPSLSIFLKGKPLQTKFHFHISYFYSHIELRLLCFNHMFWNTLYVCSYGEACRYDLERTFNTPLILIRLGERVSGNTHDIKV